MPHLAKADFFGDPNIGLYGMATDKYAVFGKNANFGNEVLKVPYLYATVASTHFAGLFMAGNSNGLLVSSVITDDEFGKLKAQMSKSAPSVKIEKIDDKNNVLGNLVLCNDNVAIVSKTLRAQFSIIEKTLKVPVIEGNVLETDLVGSFCVATNRGFLLTMNAEEPEYEFFKKHLKVNGDIGTVNLGGIFVKSGLIANSNGFFAGKMSSGPEIGRIDESLGFI